MSRRIPSVIKINKLLWVFGLLLPALLPAQNVEGFWSTIQERIDKKDYLRVNGGLQTSAQFNAISGLDRRTDPFTWRLNASLNLDFLGIQAPFSAAFSDGNSTYNIPAYGFYGLSPTYKWISLHLGDRSMNFSRYTLSGHNFFGVGLELRPGKFYGGLMYGRLRRARVEDINSIQNFEPAYKRMGYGMKVGFSDDKNTIEAIVFKAQDEIGSIPDPIQNPDVQPMDNVVVGLSGRRQIGSLFRVDMEVARSALSRDRRAAQVSSGPGGILHRMLGLYQPRVSTGYHNAFNLGVTFTPLIGQFSLQYERIDPGYRTLGALFFNNDLENITAGTALPLFKKKVNLSANLGLQRNDLDGAESTTFKRFIGSFNLSANVTERLSLNTSVSNFSTTNRIRAVSIPFIQVDSIVLAQTNTSASASVNYLGGSEKNSIYTALFSYQRANTIEDEQIDFDQRTSFYMGILSHTLQLKEQDFSLSTSCLFNLSNNAFSDVATVGPSLSANKSLWNKKVQLNAAAAYSMVYIAGERTNNVLTLQIGSSWQVTKKQSLNFRLAHVISNATSSAIDTRVFREWTGGINYGYQF